MSNTTTYEISRSATQTGLAGSPLQRRSGRKLEGRARESTPVNKPTRQTPTKFGFLRDDTKAHQTAKDGTPQKAHGNLPFIQPERFRVVACVAFLALNISLANSVPPLSVQGTLDVQLHQKEGIAHHATRNFNVLIDTNGWHISGLMSEVGGDFTNVYIFMPNFQASVLSTNAEGLAVRERKLSTAIVEPGAIPGSQWCEDAAPLWHALVSGVSHRTITQKHGAEYMPPLVCVESHDSDLLYWGFTQRVHRVTLGEFPHPPVSTTWYHDGTHRRWKTHEERLLVPPDVEKMKIPYANGYTNAEFFAEAFTNLHGWTVPTRARYSIHVRTRPKNLKAINLDALGPTRVFRTYRIGVTNVSTTRHRTSYLPDVNGHEMLVKDNRFARSDPRVPSVSYYETNSWRSDAEVRSSSEYQLRLSALQTTFPLSPETTHLVPNHGDTAWNTRGVIAAISLCLAALVVYLFTKAKSFEAH